MAPTSSGIFLLVCVVLLSCLDMSDFLFGSQKSARNGKGGQYEVLLDYPSGVCFRCVLIVSVISILYTIRFILKGTNLNLQHGICLCLCPNKANMILELIWVNFSCASSIFLL